LGFPLHILESLQDKIGQRKAMIQAMEHRLERHLDRLDEPWGEYAARRAQLTDDERRWEDLRHEHTYLEREIRACQAAIDDGNFRMCSPEEWAAALAECRRRMEEVDAQILVMKLKAEYKALHGTLKLHHDGIDKCDARQKQIEAELNRLEGGAQ
jgi:chromosome segregation ATPase